MNVLILWHKERLWTIQSITTITKPRKPFESYKEGEHIEAKFKSTAYPGIIVRIHSKYFFLSLKIIPDITL